MKTLTIFLLTVLLAAAGSGLELKTLDGQVLKQVEIISQNPIGMYVSYYDAAQQMTIVKQIKFNNLPEDVRRQYNYNPEKAAQYEKHLHRALAAAAAKEEVRATRERKHEKEMAKIDQEIKQILENNKIFVKIHVIQAGHGGVIAWASTYTGIDRNDLGQIFLYGVSEPQGDVWEGTIYPANTTLNMENMSYNTYVTPYDLAFGIWKNRYLQTGSLGQQPPGDK